MTLKDKPTDELLILEIEKGNTVAFRTLFDRHYSKMLRTAVMMVKDVEPAKDIVQETFLQIWKKRNVITINSSVEAYLKRAVVNRCLNYAKSLKRFEDENKLINQVSTYPSAIDYLEENDVHVALQKGLNSLPERCRIIFIMKRIEGMSQKEIAEALNISVKSVENQMTKALKFLKKAVEPFVENKNMK